MIHEVDEALRALLRGALPEGTGDVVFEAPTRDWAARRNAPTLNSYLYDIREDVARRERGAFAERGADGTVLRRRQPLRWFRLSYLLTAWTNRPEDEHRLLSAALGTLLGHEVLPPDGLPDALAALRTTLPLSVAVPPPESRSIADIWSALGGELKPSLDVVLTVPFPVSPTYEVAPPVTEGAAVGIRGLDGEQGEARPRMLRKQRTEPLPAETDWGRANAHRDDAHRSTGPKGKGTR
ncbi:DUF4255 domain-containing protein [Streptomyces sp. NPDC047123]|uniref:DUF4255 domain-containing protein n=1 Tax=Streptomyces sp. NPDC047123 TaxID=3155622 RepID=UPI0033D1E939